MILDVIEDGGSELTEKRRAFYAGMGFQSLPDRPLRMFIGIDTVRSAAGGSGSPGDDQGGYDAAIPTEIAPHPDRNPSRFADTSPLAGDLPALVGESPALVGESPTSRQQRCEALCDEITTLAGHLNAANYRFLKLLDEFDRHDGWAGDGIRSLAHWLNFKCGFGDLVAREKVRVARALRSLPTIGAG